MENPLYCVPYEKGAQSHKRETVNASAFVGYDEGFTSLKIAEKTRQESLSYSLKKSFSIRESSFTFSAFIVKTGQIQDVHEDQFYFCDPRDLCSSWNNRRSGYEPGGR